MTHSELVEVAYRWVLKYGSCGVAFKELNSAARNAEYPDVIGFGSGDHSLLIECKATRSDFLSDKKKMFRRYPEQGMGKYRYMCCEPELIKVAELPNSWGLIYVIGNIAKCVHNPYGPSPLSNIRKNGFKQNALAEKDLMYSALRRLFIKGYVKYIYDKDYERGTPSDILIERNIIPSGEAIDKTTIK